MSMQFVYKDLGQRQRGDRVQFELSGNAANVVLLDGSNFSAFKAGRRHTYHGGLTKESPVVLTVPRSGHWYAVVWVPAGRVRASISLLPGPLRPLRQTASPLATIRQAVEEFSSQTDAGDDVELDKAKDVFISHAGEDKESVVRPLAVALQARDVSVWYDEWELRIGDNLRQKIDAGLGQSRFGVVVLSPAFFAKPWPSYELDGLVTRELAGSRQLILPVWHGLTHADVLAKSASLANKLARDTTTSTIDQIADEIASVVLD